ncbi:MAG: LysM peptidoglycan-binding domain-containing protein [Candidatus Moranbacteria bacterium]|nr:LysM peptidoglycan-binding domain-containing protein [Candidatus Moranbacteria bacterium]
MAQCLRRRSYACFVAGWVRKYAATFVVALCVLLVALINISSGENGNGSILDTLAGKDSSPSPIKTKLATETSRKNNLAVAHLSDTNNSAGPADYSAQEDYYSAEDFASMYQPEPTLENQIILASVGAQVPASSKSRQGAKTYEIKAGDTAGSIAAAFGVSTSTVLSANNLSDTSLLKLGDKLTILPITGASYKVQKGDSLEVIAKKYNVDVQKVIAYNEITADGNLKEGQTLVLPDGYISPIAPSPNSSTQLAISGQGTSTVSSAFAPIRLGGGGGGHRFPYGYCTWYVAQKRYVPWGGNASSWLTNARASGKATGRAPRPGAIMVSGESRWGHVALVESVNGSSFTVSEMNYAGFGKKSTRTISTNSGVVRGFIY